MIGLYRSALKSHFDRLGTSKRPRDEYVRLVVGHTDHNVPISTAWTFFETFVRAMRSPGVVHIWPENKTSISTRPGSLHLQVRSGSAPTIWRTECSALDLPKYFRSFEALMRRAEHFEPDDPRIVIIPMRCVSPAIVSPYKPTWQFMRRCGLVDGELESGAHAFDLISAACNPRGLKFRRRSAKARKTKADV